MKTTDLAQIEYRIKRLKKTEDTITLIDIFISRIKESKQLDLASEYGTAPTYSSLSTFNQTKISRSDIYELIGKEIEELLEVKKQKMLKAYEEIDIVKFLSGEVEA